MNLSQINNLIKQTQQQIERGRQTVDQVKSTASQVNNVVTEVTQALGPIKDIVNEIESVVEQVQRSPLNPTTLAQLGAAIMALHAAHQAGRPGIMGALSAYNKAIIAFVMSALIIIEAWTGYNPGITESSLVTILAILTPILVWLFPNYPK
jgi:ABC-type transporter Mla subunit MlaD